MKKVLVLTFLFLASTGLSAFAAGGVFVYPAKGQSQAQIEKDKAECHGWAVRQTGFDPAEPPRATAPPPPQAPPEGGLLRGAARGAALGAIGGAIAGNAGKGAAIGAATGGLFGVMRRRDQVHREQAAQEQWAQQQAAQYEAGRRAYDRAFRACMTGRGYTVQ